MHSRKKHILFSHLGIGLILLSSLLYSPSTAVAVNNPYQISHELHQNIRAGLDYMYNLKYEKSVELFQKLQPYAEDNPMIAFGLASAHWWRLSVLVLETDPEESQPFLDAVQYCMEISEKKINEGDPTGEGHLAYGGILGLWGRYEATNRNWLFSYFKGKKAIKYLKKAEKINPNLHDAKMGMGIFNYYVATLPAVVRILAFLGSGADKEKGLEELHQAADKGFYSSVPSKLFLIDIYARSENKPEKSIQILSDLKKDYPLSPFIHILEVITFYNFGSMEKLQEAADEWMKRLEKETYPTKYATQAYFAKGLTFFRQKNWEEARKAFGNAIASDNPLDAFHSWSTLYRGYCNDALGNRALAMEDYQRVLEQRRRWDSWDNARKRLKIPFEGTDEEIKLLTL